MDNADKIASMIIRNERNNLKLTFGKRNTEWGKMYDYKSAARESIRILKKYKHLA